MANFKYFADTAAGPIEFSRIDHRRDGAYGFDDATRSWIKTNRKVIYKAFASKHECDARCINATGKTMQCECACGGKNHGRGSFYCAVA